MKKWNKGKKKKKKIGARKNIKMDILMKSRGKFRRCIQDPMGNWFFQHMETMNTTKWQRKNQMAEVLRQLKEVGDALLSTDTSELSDFLPDNNQLSGTKVLPSQGEATCDMHLGTDNELQRVEISQGVQTPMTETVQLIKEQLKEANLAREIEEEELRQSVKCIQETFKAELQVEREMKHLLQEQLREAKLTHQQDCMTHRSEVRNLQQQVENLQEKLEQEVNQHDLLQKRHEELRQSFKYSQESLTSMLQSERKTKQLLQEQLKDAKNSHQEDTINYMMELKIAQQQTETLRSQVQREIDQRTILCKEHEELKQSIECIQETFIAELQVERDMKQLYDEQMKEAKLSHEQQCVAYRNELENAQKQAETIKHELEQERNKHQVFKREQEDLKLSFQSKQDSLTLLLHTEEEAKQLLKEQVTEAKLECTKYRTELEEVQRQADDLKVQLQDEVACWMLYKQQEEQYQSSSDMQEALQAELKLERDIKQHLQEQLREAKSSHVQECAAYRAEVEKHQKQAESLKLELGREIEQRELVQTENRELQHSLQYTLEAKRSYQQDCNNCRAELRSVQKQAEHLRCQFQREIQQRTIFQELHEEMKQSLKCTQRSYTFLLQAEREMSQLLQKELNVVRRSNLQDCLNYKRQIIDTKKQLTDSPRHEEEREDMDEEGGELEKLWDLAPEKLQSEHGLENCLQISKSAIQQDVQVRNPPQTEEEIFCTGLANHQRSDEASQPTPDKNLQQINILHDKESVTQEEHKDICEQEILAAENKQGNMQHDHPEEGINKGIGKLQALAELQVNIVEKNLHTRRLPCELASCNDENLSGDEKELQVHAVEQNLHAGSLMPALTSCNKENISVEKIEETTLHDTTTEEFQVLSVHSHLLEEILSDYHSCYGGDGPEEHEETSIHKTLAEEFHVLTVVNSFPEEDGLWGCNLYNEETSMELQRDVAPHKILDDSSPCQDVLSPVEREEDFGHKSIADPPLHGSWPGEGMLSEEDNGEMLAQLSSEKTRAQGNRQMEVLSCSSDEEGFGFLKTPHGNTHHNLSSAEKEAKKQWCGLSVQ